MSLRPVVLSLVLLFSCQALAVESIYDRPVGCISESLEKLVKDRRLISQSDPALVRSSLALDKGGLCGPTCVLHMFAAMDHEFGMGLANGNAIEEITALYHAYAQSTDIRMGTTPALIANALGNRLRSVGRYPKIETKDLRVTNLAIEDLTSEEASGGVMLAFFAYDSQGKSVFGHWVTPVMVNRDSQTIKFIDPNYPSIVSEWEYRSGAHNPQGHGTFQLYPSHSRHEEQGRPLSYYAEKIVRFDKPRKICDPIQITQGEPIENMVGKRVRAVTPNWSKFEGVMERLPDIRDPQVGYLVTISRENQSPLRIPLQELQKLELLEPAGDGAATLRNVGMASSNFLEWRIFNDEFLDTNVTVAYFPSGKIGAGVEQEARSTPPGLNAGYQTITATLKGLRFPSISASIDT